MATPGRFIDCEQGGDIWKELRCGYVTASRAKDVIAIVKKGESADRKNYRLELIFERMTKTPYPQTAEYARQVQWGKQHEAAAAAAYELHAEVMVDRCGFVIHPTVERFGASPDRLVAPDGMIQIKCPTPKVHLGFLEAGIIPLEHVPQMLAEMACAGTEWCDFVSYHPQLPLLVRRYHRDEKLIAALEAEVVHFNAEIDAVMKTLPALPAGPAPVISLLDHSDPEEMQP